MGLAAPVSFMDLNILISYNFRVVKYSFPFDFSNCLKI